MNLVDLPKETIEHIFEYVREDDLLELKLVNKAINQVIAESVEIRYRLELFLAGLEDHRSGDSEPLIERLNELRLWQERWDHAGSSPSQTITLPTRWDTTEKYSLHGGVFAIQNGDIIHFTRLPSPSRGVSLSSWSTPHLGFVPVGNFTIDPDQDLLVLMERRALDKLIIRTLDMNGRQHPRATLNPLFLHLALPPDAFKLARMTVTGPNAAVLIVVDLWGYRMDSLWVFDWTNGRAEMRLKGLSITNIVFVDEFHLATCSSSPRDKDAYCLGLHDIRRGSSHVSFELPPHAGSSHFDPGLFCYPHPGPISTFHGSATHAVLAMTIRQRDTMTTSLLVVHPQSLYDMIGREDSYVRWEQWKDKAGLLGTFRGDPENDLQITAGLRLMTPLGQWYRHEGNPMLRLHTFRPCISPRDKTCHKMRFRTAEVPFNIPGSSANLTPMISEENILWIDNGHGDAPRLTVFSV